MVLGPLLAHLKCSIVRVPFTGSVKLRSVLIKSGPGDQTPSKVALVSSDTPSNT